MADVKTVPAEKLFAFVRDVCLAHGMPAADAEIQAHCLIEAHMRGFDTHGIECLPDYAACLKENRIKPKPDIRITHSFPWAIQVDGDNGMGHVVATRAMRACLEAASRIGIGVATVRRSNHFGAACLYPLMAIEHDCIGIAAANAAPSVAPWGASKGLVGTNPLSIAVPAGDAAPFVMDFATSIAARRKIRAAMDTGERIPEGWAIDREGRPTTDPKEAMAGVSLPFGGPKGSAIALLIDILSGVLSGGMFGGDVVNFFNNKDREGGAGAFVAAIRIDAFMPMKDFGPRMDELVRRVHDLPPAEGFERVRMPGERGAELSVRRKKDGIPVPAKLAAKLSVLGEGVGVPFPSA